jgi:WD40 repeat protein
MRRRLKYLSLLCCSLLLVLFFGQINGSTVGQEVSNISEDTAVTSIAFSSDGSTLASGTEKGQVVLIDVATSKEKKKLPGHLGSRVTEVAFQPKDETLATQKNEEILASVGRDSVARVWNLKTGKQINLLQGHENPPRTIAYSPDGKYIATAGEDTRIAVWNAKNGKLLHLLEGHDDFVNSVAFSPDSKSIASGADDARIFLWEVKTGKLHGVALGHTKRVTSVAFSPDGKLLASASRDNTVRLWNAKNLRQKEILDSPVKKVKKLNFSPDGTLLAGGGDENQVVIWNVETGTLLETLQGNNKTITAVAFSPTDANTLVSADEEGEVIEWDVAKREQKKKIKIRTEALEELNSEELNLEELNSEELNLDLVKSGKVEKTKSLLKTPTLSSSNKTLIAAVPPPPDGPILLVTSPSNSFGDYYTEILRNEGLNLFQASNISSVSSSTLANYDTVILAEMALSPAQVTMFTDWVNSGGNLIAMRPDKQLASLLGLTDTGTTLSNNYLLIDTSKAPGNGLVNQTIQFHGTADRYTLNGATSVATLYTNATTATSNPAVTLHSVGSNGGQAAAFTYDLARSIIYTRQGNPDWAGQERDGFSPMRSNDMFYGNASGDPQPDWVDLNKVAIPQADEQQRLLANLILTMNSSKKPLPRFWYFPRGEKAVVLMTGDDHGNGGTAPRFDQFEAMSPQGCSVEDWECIRGTSYIYSNTPISDAQAAAYDAKGFEIALHVSTNCQNFTPTSLESFYTQQLAQFSTSFPSLPDTSTQRHHCIAWSGWSTTPEVELNHGIRLNTTYYYWPSFWALNRPGFFTGSGMPMRLTQIDGTIIDVYEANTQMTDESGQIYPYTVDTLLDRALGAEGYYGVFDVNAHTDLANSSVSDAVVNSAKARNVPVISSRQLLTWLDGRNSSAFGSLTWNNTNSTLSFTITQGTGANGLQAMLPAKFGNKTLEEIQLGGSPVTHTTEQIKGIEYAKFSANTGSYVVKYGVDTDSPTVTLTSPTNSATNMSVATSITATFNEAIDPATINTNTFELRNSANALVPAIITYDAATRTATLTPNTSLAENTTYTATLKGGTTDPRVKDLAANALAADYTWSFTTGSLPCAPGQPCSIWSNSATPTNPSIADPNAVELGVKFRSDMNGYITGIRFYKSTSNTGTHVGTLWSSNGQQLGRATFTNETASGWQQVNFATPVPITANTDYVASYHTKVGRYAGDQNFFANSGVDNAPLHALSNGISGGNGVYRYNANPAFPTNSFRASNYWVDIVFTTSTAPDTTPPTVTATNPSNAATGLPTGTTVSATFSEVMNAATININTFVLRDANNTLVPASVTYDAANKTATLTPSSSLATGTTYTATIKGGSTDPRVKDQAGNALVQDYTWSFTTTNTSSSFSIWDNTVVPSLVTENDNSAVTLGVKFSANQNGYITGIRFYKGPQNTGTHIGTLWSISGQALAQATFTNETATGWQQVNFTTPVAITANTVYVASYHTSVGFYSQDAGYFTNSGVNNPPLYALRNGENGANGIYIYSASPVFPTSTYQSANYWVDVVFTPN